MLNPEGACTCHRRAGGQGACARTSFHDDQAAVSRVLAARSGVFSLSLSHTLSCAVRGVFAARLPAVRREAVSEDCFTALLLYCCFTAALQAASSATRGSATGGNF